MWNSGVIIQVLFHSLNTCVFLGACVWFYKHKKKNLPPGPFGLPFVGYLPFLRKSAAHITFCELGKKYGPIYSIRLGTKLFVILTNAKCIKEAFLKPELYGRPVIPFFELLHLSNPFFENGTIWQQHRKLLGQAFRTFGLGQSSMNDHIIDEVKDFMKILTLSRGNALNIREPLTATLSNIIAWLILGEKLTNDKRITMDNNVNRGLEIFEKTAVLIFFPWMLHLPFVEKLFYYEHFKKMQEDVKSILRKEIVEQGASLDGLYMPSCFTNMYLKKMKTGSKDLDNTFNDATLVGSVSNLYAAGISSVLPTLEWCFYVMAAMPEVQRKIQEELDNVVGHERLPEISDQKSLPFTLSVLMEIQRKYTVLPLNTPRIALENLQVSGYTIPKGTCVMANFYAAHHDPDIWNKPEEFLPNRFLSPDGKEVTKCDSYMPFSIGKRNCPAEGISIIEIFLCFTCVLQRFHISIPDGESVDLEGIMKTTYELKPHKLCFTQRT